MYKLTITLSQENSTLVDANGVSHGGEVLNLKHNWFSIEKQKGYARPKIKTFTAICLLPLFNEVDMKYIFIYHVS